jgi:predicted  nucleic acid-binding Zn-ribbon protein
MPATRKSATPNGSSKGHTVDHLVEQLLTQQPESRHFLDWLMAKTEGKGKTGPFAPLQGNCCSACNLSLPTAQLQRIISGEMLNCSSCQRYLYIETIQAA